MLIVALSLFGAWDLFRRFREAATTAARLSLAVRLIVPAFLGGSLGFLCALPDPLPRNLALLGLGIVLFALCVAGGLRKGSFEAAGATLWFFAVGFLVASVPSLRD